MTAPDEVDRTLWDDATNDSLDQLVASAKNAGKRVRWFTIGDRGVDAVRDPRLSLYGRILPLLVVEGPQGDDYFGVPADENQRTVSPSTTVEHGRLLTIYPVGSDVPVATYGPSGWWSFRATDFAAPALG